MKLIEGQIESTPNLSRSLMQYRTSNTIQNMDGVDFTSDYSISSRHVHTDEQSIGLHD